MKKAILDKDNVLIGFKEVKKLKDGDIDGGAGDLDTNHKYKWTGKEFMALGFGFPRPIPLEKGITKDHVFYLLMKALTTGTPIPIECNYWVAWYEDNLKKRNEEHLKRGGKQ